MLLGTTICDRGKARKSPNYTRGVLFVAESGWARFAARRAGTTTEWSYTGEQNDPTGLEYLRARYYDASTGRFLSQDPLPLLQRYAYANNNPANLVDPSGLSTAKDRFDQLMDAERQIQFVANQILHDPCWKTRAFCAHVALMWREAPEYGWECAKGAFGGAAVGGLIGASAGGVGVGGGILAGATWGCAGALASHGADEIYSALGGARAFGGNASAQCAFAAVAAAGTYYSATRGGSASLTQAGIGAGGGCVGGVLGWFTKTVMGAAGADAGADGVGQCGMAGATAIGFALGRNDALASALWQGAGACTLRGVTERIPRP